MKRQNSESDLDQVKKPAAASKSEVEESSTDETEAVRPVHSSRGGIDIAIPFEEPKEVPPPPAITKTVSMPDLTKTEEIPAEQEIVSDSEVNEDASILPDRDSPITKLKIRIIHIMNMKRNLSRMSDTELKAYLKIIHEEFELDLNTMTFLEEEEGEEEILIRSIVSELMPNVEGSIKSSFLRKLVNSLKFFSDFARARKNGQTSSICHEN